MFSAISRHWQTLTPPNTSSETEILSLWAPLIQSGLTVTESIQLLAEGAEQAGDKIGFQAVLISLGRGLTLFQAIQNSSLPISDSVLQGIKSAEQTGHLGEMLWLASENTKAIQTMRAKAWEAARYPLIIGSLALLILTGLIIGIVPKFESLYSRMGSELPEATQFLMSLSQLVQHHGALTLVGAVLLLTAFYQGLKTPTGQIGWDWLMNRLPVISPLRQELFSHRLISNLELLVNSGVVLPDALRASADVIPSPSYQRALIEASRSIRQGQRSDLALNQSLLSPLMRQLWSLGVRSGRLTEFLRIGREVLGVRLHNRLSILTSFLEPTLMAVLGLLTGGVMLALYQPIFSLGDAL